MSFTKYLTNDGKIPKLKKLTKTEIRNRLRRILLMTERLRQQAGLSLDRDKMIKDEEYRMWHYGVEYELRIVVDTLVKAVEK